MKEIWKDIPNYKGIYEVSNHGRVKSLKRKWCKFNKILKQGKSIYYYVVLFNNKISRSWSVHQLMAITFLNHKPDGYKLIVDHKDNNPLNNHLSNLQLITHRENCSKNKNYKQTGVRFKSNKYEVNITIRGSYIYLGRYDDLDKSRSVYKKALNNLDLFNGDIALFKKNINIK